MWTFLSSDWTYILGLWVSTYSSYFCAMSGQSPCSVIAISSACGPDSSIHTSSLLECSGFSFRLCLSRARSEIHSLLFALLSPLFLPRFLDIYPLQSDFLFLCSLYHFPCIVPFLMDFRVLTTLIRCSFFALSLFSLRFIAFACFYNGLG